MPNVVGPYIQRQAPSHVWTPSGGFVFLPRYEGLTDAMLGFANQLRLQGRPYTFRPDGATAVIEIQDNAPEDGTVETPRGSWQLLGEERTKDLTESPAFKALEAATPLAAKEIIDYLKGREDKTSSQTTYCKTGNAKLLYDLAYRRQDTYGYQVPVLRHSQIASNRYDQSLTGDNIYKIYTTAQLKAECAQFSEPLPNMFLADIDKLATLSDSDGYVAGWLKRLPVIQQVAGERIEVSIEYIYEAWSTVLYAAV